MINPTNEILSNLMEALMMHFLNSYTHSREDRCWPWVGSSWSSSLVSAPQGVSLPCSATCSDHWPDSWREEDARLDQSHANHQIAQPLTHFIHHLLFPQFLSFLNHLKNINIVSIKSFHPIKLTLMGTKCIIRKIVCVETKGAYPDKNTLAAVLLWRGPDL